MRVREPSLSLNCYEFYQNEIDNFFSLLQIKIFSLLHLQAFDDFIFDETLSFETIAICA